MPKGASVGFVDNAPRTTFSREGEPDVFAGSESSDWTAAIVGGTGAYAGTRGTLRSVTGRSGTRTDTLQLLP